MTRAQMIDHATRRVLSFEPTVGTVEPAAYGAALLAELDCDLPIVVERVRCEFRRLAEQDAA